jgi:hypothetical protein
MPNNKSIETPFLHSSNHSMIHNIIAVLDFLCSRFNPLRPCYFPDGLCTCFIAFGEYDEIYDDYLINVAQRKQLCKNQQ